MSIMFLGTSNCIVKNSFIQFLRPIIDEPVKVHALGASTSAVGCFLLQQHAVETGDIVFIDFSINENAALTLNVRSPRQIRLQIGTIVQTVLEGGGIPILLLLPCHATLVEASKAETLHQAFCEEFGIPCLNLAELFRKVLATGLSSEMLMRDPMHAAATVTPVIAELIARTIRAIRAAPVKTRRMRVPSRPMRALYMTELRPARPVRKHVTLIYSGDFQTIEADDVVDIPMQPNEVLHSMMVNRGVPGSKVSLAGGNDAVVKNMVLYWDKAEPTKFHAGLIDVRRDAGPKDGHVSLSLLPWSAAETERTLNSQPPLNGSYGSIEVQAFLIAGPARRLPAKADFPDFGLDLLAVTAEAEAVRMISEAALA